LLSLPQSGNFSEASACDCIHSDSNGFQISVSKHVDFTSETFTDSATALFWCASAKEYRLTKRSASITYPHPAYTVEIFHTRALR
jgi:hypothetical protein